MNERLNNFELKEDEFLENVVGGNNVLDRITGSIRPKVVTRYCPFCFQGKTVSADAKSFYCNFCKKNVEIEE